MHARSLINRTIIRSALSAGLLLGLSTPGQAQNGFIPFYVTGEGLNAGAGTAGSGGKDSPGDGDAGCTISNPAVLGRLNSHAILTTGWLHREQYFDSSGAVGFGSNAPPGTPPFGNPIGRQRNRFREIPMGTGAFNIRLNEQWAWGMVLTGGGAYVRYNSSTNNPALLNPPNGGFNTLATNRILLGAATLAYNPWKTHSYGASLLIGYSNFKSNLALANNTQTVGANRPDSAAGVGVRIGGIWDLSDLLTVGASAATPVYFSNHKKYLDVFTHKMQIPGTIRLGTTWHLASKLDFLFDLKGIFYGECKWLKTLDWKNQFPIILTGVNYKFTDHLTVGVGYNYGRMPIRKNKVFINALSSPIDQHIFSGGFRFKVTERTELLALAFYVPKGRITDDGTFLSFAQGSYLEGRAMGMEVGIKVNFG